MLKTHILIEVILLPVLMIASVILCVCACVYIPDHTTGSILLFADVINEDSLPLSPPLLSVSHFLCSSFSSSSPTGLITHKHSFLFPATVWQVQTNRQKSK